MFQSILQIIQELSAHYDFVVAHSVRQETPPHFKGQFPKGTRFILLPMARTINPVIDYTAVHQLRSIIRKIKPAYIHAHSSKAGAVARIAAIGMRMPVGYSPRSYAFLMKSSPKVFRAIYLAAELALGMLPATTIACGHDEATIARRISRKVAVVPNAEPIEKAIKPKPFSLPLRIVSTGRITPQKGFDQFLSLAHTVQDIPVTFTWIGGPKPNHQLPPNVTVTGWLNHADTRKHLNDAHAYLSLSLWEGLPRAALEAMSRCLPVLLSDIPGHRELVTPETGFIVRNAMEFRWALQQWKNTPALYTSQAYAARSLVETAYSPATSMKALKKLYDGEI